MGLFLVWRHRLICIVLSLCKHACKEVCDVKQGVDSYPLLARSCERWSPDFVTFTACKRPIVGLKRGKKAQCVSNRCKDWFERKKYFGDIGTLRPNVKQDVDQVLTEYPWRWQWRISHGTRLRMPLVHDPKPWNKSSMYQAVLHIS